MSQMSRERTIYWNNQTAHEKDEFENTAKLRVDSPIRLLRIRTIIGPIWPHDNISIMTDASNFDQVPGNDDKELLTY